MLLFVVSRAIKLMLSHCLKSQAASGPIAVHRHVTRMTFDGIIQVVCI